MTPVADTCTTDMMFMVGSHRLEPAQLDDEGGSCCVQKHRYMDYASMECAN